MSSVARFSIVTPSYNQAAYIGETIESVLSQAGEFEIEYFIMDGGSTDGSVEIIKSYAERLARGEYPLRCVRATLVWVSQKDKGQSDAINRGLQRATGEVASYINSDDAFCDEAFARVLQGFAARPEADIIYGDGDVIGAAGELQWEWLSRPYDHGVMTSYHFWWNDFTNYIMQQATFWRRSVMERIGYFDENFHYAMDAEYWIRAGHHGLHLHHLPHKLGRFRLIAGTKSLSSPTVFWGDYLEIFRRYRDGQPLDRFFAYYFYNVAKYVDYDLNRTQSEGASVMQRWADLPTTTRTALDRQAQRGFALSCLLIANDLLSHGELQKAEIAFARGTTNHKSLVVHPLAAAYRLKHLLGERLSMRWELYVERLTKWYKSWRFDYRYQQKNS
ncbi:MAG: glycosyltransferase family 2 protein [Anaerolineales bacterium]